MTELSLLAPAKLNLFLHVTGRRADGYHELQTLFQILDYGDWMRFKPRRKPGVELHIADTEEGRGLPQRGNLILRAAAALARATGVGEGAAITVEKRIPVGGGLGGGSANAAVTLLALNELWRLGLSLDALCEIGVRLGADVPVFIRGRSAWGEGVGEVLRPVKLPEQCYLVVAPPCNVSTAAVFNDENLTRNSANIRIADFLAGRCRNDCEPVTRRLYPEVDRAFAWLGRFGEPRMSGTGASVFITLPEAAAAKPILAELPTGWRGFAANGMERMAHARAGSANEGCDNEGRGKEEAKQEQQ